MTLEAVAFQNSSLMMELETPLRYVGVDSCLSQLYCSMYTYASPFKLNRRTRSSAIKPLPVRNSAGAGTLLFFSPSFSRPAEQPPQNQIEQVSCACQPLGAISSTLLSG